MSAIDVGASRQVRTVLATIATLFSFAATLATLSHAVDTWIALLPIPIFFLIGAFLLHVTSPILHMFGKGAIWSAVIMNLLIVHATGSAPFQERMWPTAAVLFGCLALLLSPKSIQNPPGKTTFQPVAHHRTLTVALVLALADTLSLAFWSYFSLLDTGLDSASLSLLGCFAFMSVGVFGLARLKLWGLIANICSNILVAWLTWTETIDFGALKLVFATTALLQLIVPIPLVASLFRGRPMQVWPWLQGIGARLPNTVVAGAMVLAVQPFFGKSVLVEIGRWILR